MTSSIETIYFKTAVPISEVTTYKTSGSLGWVYYPKNQKELAILLNHLSSYNLPYFILGNGSNLLINPQTKKIAISLARFPQKIFLKNSALNVSANTSLAKIYHFCKGNNLSGFEKLATIPASLGGAIKNNASFLDVSCFDYLNKITALKDGKIKKISKKDCFFAHHKTNLENLVILSASFTLPPATADSIAESYKTALSFRLSHQPKGFSCGSIFRNPEGQSAGYLIEKCGLKGKRRGGAVISDKHANFIINDFSATFDDVKYLIDCCKEEVLGKFGITLEEEVEIIQ